MDNTSQTRLCVEESRIQTEHKYNLGQNRNQSKIRMLKNILSK